MKKLTEKILIFRQELNIKLIRLEVLNKFPDTAINNIIGGWELVGVYEDKDNNFTSHKYEKN